jgi:ribosome-associated heat shock protein Hsp15
VTDDRVPDDRVPDDRVPDDRVTDDRVPDDRVTEGGPTTRRLDQWLWFARFVKSRSLAARLCTGGAVSVNGEKARKASRAIRPGDLLGLRLGKSRRRIRVLALGNRRGSGPEARGLYEEFAVEERTVPEWEPLLPEEGG